ncbi:MAG: L28 family ribosomal protein [Patescibacteria group bacterium]|nr:L28 family ribosomal protein [Patescibacteria group bacterium]
MSKICDLCGRRALKGNLRSHSNIAVIHRQQLNLHSRKIGGVRKKICVHCIKTMHREDAGETHK